MSDSLFGQEVVCDVVVVGVGILEDDYKVDGVFDDEHTRETCVWSVGHCIVVVKSTVNVELFDRVYG